jgi:hypothetical protein
MTLHVSVFVLLLVVCLLLLLVRLGRLGWFPLQPCSSQGVAKRTGLPRLLKPRCPDDCPACRLATPASLGRGPAPGPVRPWREIKSRRGAPKRIPTDGFACPNRQCTYFGNTDAHWHALVGDGKHGKAEPIQTFRCQACRTTFTSRRNTPLYRLKTSSQQVAVVLSALAEGLDASAAERVFGSCLATITRWLTRAGKHAELFHEHSFRNLHMPHLQLDEIRTWLRRSSQVLWLWLALDPRTKIVPVLQLGPRTQSMAHRVIHSLRELLAPGCMPLFTSDGLNLYFYAALGSLWSVAHLLPSRAQGAPVAGGGRADLRAGEEKLPAAQTDSRHACDAAGDTEGSHNRPAGIGFFWEVEYRFYRTGESDRAPWRSSSGKTDLGYFATSSPAAGPSRMVACVLPFCPSPCSAAGEARAAARTRRQPGGASLSPADPSDGSCKRQGNTEPSARAKLSHLLAVQTIRTVGPVSANSGESGSSRPPSRECDCDEPADPAMPPSFARCRRPVSIGQRPDSRSRRHSLVHSGR